MKVEIYYTWHPELGQRFGVKAVNISGESFVFGARYETEGEAVMDQLLIKDFINFASEDTIKRLQQLFNEIQQD